MTWSIGIVLRVHCVCWWEGDMEYRHCAPGSLCVYWWEGDMEYRNCAPGSLCVLVGG